MMNHGNIVQDAWRITWNNKYLWLLGFLAALTGSGSGGGGGNFGGSGFSEDLPRVLEEGPFGNLSDTELAAVIGAVAGVVLVALCVLLIIFLVLWLVGLTARAGLIVAVDQIEDGQKSSFGDAMRSGFRFLWRLVGMKLLLTLGVLAMAAVVVVAALLLIVPVASGESNAMGVLGGVGILLLCTSVCLIIPLFILLRFIDAYAYRGIVLHDLGAVASLRHGWRIFRDNLGDSLILGLIFALIGMVVQFILLAALAPIAIIAFGPLSSFIFDGQISTGAVVAIAIGILVFIVVGALLSSIVTAFQSAGFTLAYRHFTGLAGDDQPLPREKGPEDVGYDPLI